MKVAERYRSGGAIVYVVRGVQDDVALVHYIMNAGALKMPYNVSEKEWPQVVETIHDFLENNA